MTATSGHTQSNRNAHEPASPAAQTTHETESWDVGNTPPAPMSHAEARLATATREARLLGRSNARSPDWQGLISHAIADARDDSLGTLIAGRAALSHPDAPQDNPDETVAQSIADAEAGEAGRMRAETRRRRSMLLATAVAALPFAFVAAFALVASDIARIPTLAAPVQAICMGISVAAMAVLCLGALDRRMRCEGSRAGFGTQVFSLLAGTALGSCTCGLPPLTALCCWLAANEVVDSLAAADDARGPIGFRRYVEGVRREREAGELPPFVAEARRLAAELETNERWATKVTQAVRQAHDYDLGTMVAAYAVLADEENRIADAIDSEEQPSPLEADADARRGSAAVAQQRRTNPARQNEGDEAESVIIPEEVVERHVLRAGWLLGLLIGVIGAYNWYATIGQYSPNPEVAGFICTFICLAGMAAGRRRAGAFCRTEGGRRPEAYLTAISCVSWSAFWVVFLLQLACFYLGAFCT